MFVREFRDYRYLMNYTKHEFLNMEKAIQEYRPNPLPLLMVYYPYDDSDKPFMGKWLGDCLTATNGDPPDDYREMNKEYLWF